MTKICMKCNEDKPFTEFHKRAGRKYGLQSICISCRKEVNADYYKRTPEKDDARHNSRLTRKQLVTNRTEPLLLAGCTDCQNHFPVESMDFDHVSGIKVISIADLAGSSYSDAELVKLLDDELRKCEVVCANCHRIRTINRHRVSARRDYFQGNEHSKLLTEKKLYVYDFLREHSCTDCNESDMRVLELDHVRGNKVNNVSHMIGATTAFNLDEVKAEVAKCEVVCVNCHRVRTRSKKKSLSSNRGVKLTTGSKSCPCGNKKSTVNAATCRECFSKVKGDLHGHLTTEEMVAKIRLMGMKPYATTLGLSDNGLRKVLVRRGVSMPLRKQKQ
jgi:hypothetical protein